MIKVVFLDIDDTLLDFAPTCEAAMRKGCEKFGLGEYKSEMLSVLLDVTTEMWREIERGEITYEYLLEQRFNRVFERIGISFDGALFEKFFREFIFNSAVEVEGATELLEYLGKKYILCAASNGAYAQQMNRLEKADMLKYFSHCFVSEHMGASKPSKEFFSHAIIKLNEGRNKKILPSEIMMVGDSLTSDMAGGISNGLKTCFVDRKTCGNTNGLNVDYRVCRLSEIFDIL